MNIRVCMVLLYHLYYRLESVSSDKIKSTSKILHVYTERCGTHTHTHTNTHAHTHICTRVRARSAHVAVQTDNEIGNIWEWASNTYQYTLSHRELSLCERANIKFCVKLGTTGGTDSTVRMWDVYQEECMSQQCVYKWYWQFKAGQGSVDDEEREGVPTTARSDNIAHVRSITCTDRQITADAVTEKVVVSHGTCQRILHNTP